MFWVLVLTFSVSDTPINSSDAWDIHEALQLLRSLMLTILLEAWIC